MLGRYGRKDRGDNRVKERQQKERDSQSDKDDDVLMCMQAHKTVQYRTKKYIYPSVKVRSEYGRNFC